MLHLKINDKVSLLEYLISNNISIPHYCYHSTLSIAGNCRVCLIELKGLMKPITSCSTDASTALSKTGIYYDSPFVTKARENILEFLLLNHPLDCPICDQGGDCDLQDQSMRFGFLKRRFYKFKRVVNDKDLGPIIKTVMTRCIHCTRCVRFAKEISGIEELGILGRGKTSEIGTYVDTVLTSELSGNVIDLCPVGTITFKSYGIETDVIRHDCCLTTVLGLTSTERNYCYDDYMVIFPNKKLGDNSRFYGTLYECLSMGIFKTIPHSPRKEDPFKFNISISISYRLILEDDSIIESEFYSGDIPIHIVSFASYEHFQNKGDEIHHVFNLVEHYAETFDYQTKVLDFEASIRNTPLAIKYLEIPITTTYLNITRNCIIKSLEDPFDTLGRGEIENVIDPCPVGTIRFKFYEISTDVIRPDVFLMTVMGLTRRHSYYDEDYMVILPNIELGGNSRFYGTLDECLSMGIFKTIPHSPRKGDPFRLDIEISISFRLILEDDSIIESKIYSGYIPIHIVSSSYEHFQNKGDEIHHVFNLVELYAEMFDYQSEVLDFEAGIRNTPLAKVKDLEIPITTTYLGITRNCTIKINENPFGVVIPEKPFF